MAFNNFTTTIGHVLNPIGYVFQIIHREAQFNKANIQIEQQSLLLGNTYFSNKKVGV